VLLLFVFGTSLNPARAQDDQAPDNLSLISPSGSVVLSSQTPGTTTLDVTYSYDDPNADQLEIILDDGSNTVSYTFDDSGYSGGEKTRPIDLTTPDNTNGGLVDGNTYDIRIRAIDAYDNSASKTFTDRVEIDNTPPSIVEVTKPDDGLYGIGQTLEFTVEYDEAVNVNQTSGTPSIDLDIGGDPKRATFASGDGSTILTFTYVVEEGPEDTDGIAFTPTSVQLNGATLKDAAGNNAEQDFSAEAPSLGGVDVDGIRPFNLSVDAPADSTFRQTEETLSVEYSYDENVSTDSTDIRLVGSQDGEVDARYGIDDSGAGPSVDAAHLLDLLTSLSDPDSGSVEAGTTYDLRVTATDEARNSTTITGEDLLTVDDTPPTVTEITRSLPTNEVTDANSVEFTVSFSELVESVGTDDFALNKDTDVSTSGFSVGSTSGRSVTVTVNGISGDGTLGLNVTPNDAQDRAGNGLESGDPSTDATYLIDNTVPTISSATTADADGNGQIDEITLQYTEPVDVTDVNGGSDRLPGYSIDGGYTIAEADYTASSTNSLTLQLVESGTPDTDATPTVSYNRGATGTQTVADAASNEQADGDSEGAGDGAPPVLTVVETANSTLSELSVTFSEPVWTNTGPSGNLVADDFDFSDASGGSVSVSSVTHTAGTETATLGLTGQAEPGADALAAASSDIYDTVNNAAPTTATPVLDGTGPDLVSATTADPDDDGRVDQISVTYTEPVSDASVSKGDFSLTSPGASVDGTDTGTTTGDDQTVLLVSGLEAGNTAIRPDVTLNATSVQDKNGNSGPPNQTTKKAADGASPIVASTTTLDRDADGNVDAADVVFTEPVDDSEVTPGDYTLGGASPDGKSTTVGGDAETDDEKIQLQINTDGDEVNGTKAKNLTYTQGTTVDTVGNKLADVDTGDVNEADGASPVLTLVETTDAHLSELSVTFSEPVWTNTGPSGNLVADDFDFSDASGEGVSVSSVTHTAGDETATFGLTEQAQPGADALATVSNQIYDGADNPAPATSQTVLDGTGPDLMSATTADPDDDGTVDEITVTYTEAVSDGTVGTDDFTLSTGSVESVGTGTTSGDGTSVLTVSGLATSNTAVTPDVTLKATSVQDTNGNTGPSGSTTITASDGAAPVMASAETADADNNGQIDQITLQYTEPVDVTDGDANNALPGYSVDGVYTIADADYAASSTTSRTLQLQERGSPDTDVTPTISYNQGQSTVADAGNNEQADGDSQVSVDGAAPVLLRAEAVSGKTTPVTVAFSEGVSGSGGGDLSTGDFNYPNNSGDGASTVSSVETHNAGDAVATVALDAGVQAGDLGTDEVEASSITDATGNAAVGTPPLRDTKAPANPVATSGPAITASNVTSYSVDVTLDDDHEAGDLAVRLTDDTGGEVTVQKTAVPAETDADSDRPTVTVSGDVSSLADGPVDVAARITDFASNTNGAGFTASSTVTKDTQPPSTAPTLTSTAAPGGDIALNWTDVNDGTTTYSLRRSTTPGGSYPPSSEIETINDNGGSYSYTDPASGLTEGETYYYVVVPVDGVGNEGASSTEASATADATAPANLALDSPTDSTFRRSSSPNETIDVSYSYDEPRPSTVQIRLLDPGGQVDARFDVDDSGKSGTVDETVSLNLSAPNGGSVTAGTTYDLKITATDVAGNSAATTGEDRLTIDDTAPQLQTATIAADSLFLDYDEILDSGSVPATNAFTVRVNGSSVSLASTVVRRDTAAVELSSEVLAGDDVTVDYTAGSSPIRDRAETPAAALSGEPVTNATEDTTPPTVSSFPGDRTIDEDGTTGALGFEIEDNLISANDLSVSASSDNQDLVPDGNLTLGGSGRDRTIKATPAADSNGSAQITVTVEDDDGNAATGSFTLTVNPVSDVPTITAIDDQTIDEDGTTAPLSLTVDDVETAAADLTLSATSDNPAVLPDDSLTLGGSGADRTLTATPTADSNGVAEVTVQVTDQKEFPADEQETASTRFTLTVNAVNDPPVISAIADTTIDEDQPTGKRAFTVTDVESAASSLTLSTTSGNPALVPDDSLELGGSGTDRTIAATPRADSNGTTTITVTAGDGTDQTTESYRLTVDPVNDAPTIVTNEPLPTRKKALRTIEPQDLRATDIESGPANLSYTVSTQPTQGRLLVDNTQATRFTQKQVNDGKVQYEHTAESTQNDDFDFVVTDRGGRQGGLSATGTFEIDITTNTPPAASADTFATNEDQTLAVTDPANGVLANDSDPDRDPLQASPVSGVRGATPSDGSLTLDADGTFEYEPNPNFNGTDSFKYAASDGGGGRDTATVVLEVRASNDAPVIASNTGLSIDEGASATITTAELNATDPDDAAAALTYNVTTAPTQGRLLVEGNEAGRFTQQQIENEVVRYEHTAEDATDDRLTFTLTDEAGAGPTDQTFAITVQMVNAPPTAADDAYILKEGQALSVADSTQGLLANDGDPDGHPLDATLVNGPSNGSLTLNPNGTFEYTPNSGYDGADAFTYAANDGFGGSAQATVDIRVRPAQTAVTTSRTFPDPTQQRSFRLVALPGKASTPLASTLSGERGDDWRAFREDGAGESQSASRQRCGNGTACRFRPGTGYWLVSRSPWSVGDSLQTVPLASGSASTGPAYRIPLQDGWNIISNPVERDVSWSAVQAASGTDQPLWRWDGSWKRTQTFASATNGTAYYFMDDQIDELVLPFPGLSPPKRDPAPASSPDSTLALHVVQEGDTVSVVRVGLQPGAEPGLDRTDRFAPPGYFETAALRLLAQAEERSYTLAAEHVPPGRDGYTFDLRLQGPPNTALTVVPRGTDAFPAKKLALVRRPTGRTHDLRADSAFTVVPRSSTTRFQLLLGSASFVENKRRAMAPSTVKMLPNYPNPFRQATTIEYALPERQQVRLEIYDVMGRRVRVLVDGRQRAGFHRLQWRAEGDATVASGVYFARLQAGDVTKVERLVVVR
jgi:hypothetical protein